jgi:hypothetical protein
MLMIFALDEFVLPHPHGDAAPLLGFQMWLATAGIGGLSAAICVFFFLWRFYRRTTSAALAVPEASER